MKRFLLPVIVCAVACVFSISTLSAKQDGSKPVKKKGSDILHLNIRKDMSNEGDISNATARVEIKLNKQGNAYNQSLDVQVKKLDANTAYQLWAALGDDTNFVYAADFVTDKKGGDKLKFKKIGSSKGNANGAGNGKLVLPTDLDPVSNIRELAIGNVNTQAVFTADLTKPDKLQYLIKRFISEDSVSANLRLKATAKKLSFSLIVSGLETSTNYFLVANNEIVSSGDSSAYGGLVFSSLPVAPENILDIYQIGIWDSSSNVVINTQLPQ